MGFVFRVLSWRVAKSRKFLTYNKMKNQTNLLGDAENMVGKTVYCIDEKKIVELEIKSFTINGDARHKTLHYLVLDKSDNQEFTMPHSELFLTITDLLDHLKREFRHNKAIKKTYTLAS
jgi:hypothetical protein